MERFIEIANSTVLFIELGVVLGVEVEGDHFVAAAIGLPRVDQLDYFLPSDQSNRTQHEQALAGRELETGFVESLDVHQGLPLHELNQEGKSDVRLPMTSHLHLVFLVGCLAELVYAEGTVHIVEKVEQKTSSHLHHFLQRNVLQLGDFQDLVEKDPKKIHLADSDGAPPVGVGGICDVVRGEDVGKGLSVRKPGEFEGNFVELLFLGLRVLLSEEEQRLLIVQHFFEGNAVEILDVVLDVGANGPQVDKNSVQYFLGLDEVVVGVLVKLLLRIEAVTEADPIVL